MSLSIQFVSLLAMIGSGIIAGAFMDMLGAGISAAKKTSVIRKRAIWLEGLGWLLAGCFAFAVLFVFREGAWRMYDPLAQLSGLLLYAAFFHKPIRLLGRVLVILVVRPIRLLVRLVWLGLRFIIRLLFAILLFLLRPFRFIYFRLFRYHFKKVPK